MAIPYVDPALVSDEKSPTYRQLLVIAALVRGGAPPRSRREASRLIIDLEALRLLEEVQLDAE